MLSTSLLKVRKLLSCLPPCFEHLQSQKCGQMSKTFSNDCRYIHVVLMSRLTTKVNSFSLEKA